MLWDDSDWDGGRDVSGIINSVSCASMCTRRGGTAESVHNVVSREDFGGLGLFTLSVKGVHNMSLNAATGQIL